MLFTNENNPSITYTELTNHQRLLEVFFDIVRAICFYVIYRKFNLTSYFY